MPIVKGHVSTLHASSSPYVPIYGHEFREQETGNQQFCIAYLSYERGWRSQVEQRGAIVMSCLYQEVHLCSSSKALDLEDQGSYTV